MKRLAIAGLLSFNAGFADTAGFVALQGLFTAHVTGNFVTLGAALVFGAHGIIAKLVALPEFILVVAVARILGGAFRKKGADALWLLLGLEALLLTGFFLLAVMLGPFPDSDAPSALLVGFAGVAAMAIQNAVQRVHFASIPPTTIMTANTTPLNRSTASSTIQAATAPPSRRASAQPRLRRISGRDCGAWLCRRSWRRWSRSVRNRSGRSTSDLAIRLQFVCDPPAEGRDHVAYLPIATCASPYGFGRFRGEADVP